MASVSAVLRLVEEYNRRTTRVVRRQSAEMQKMLAMLADAVVALSGSTERSLGALAGVKAALEQANGFADLERVKIHLNDCLERVCQESLRQHQETESVIA
jgi:hypothetical protein